MRRREWKQGRMTNLEFPTILYINVHVHMIGSFHTWFAIGSKLYRSRLNEFPIMAFSRLQMLFALRAPMALLSCTDSQQVEQNAWWNTFYIHLRKKNGADLK